MAVCCTFGTKELYIISQKVKYFFTKNNQKIHKTSHQSLNTRCILQKSLCITNIALNRPVREAFKTLLEHLDLFFVFLFNSFAFIYLIAPFSQIHTWSQSLPRWLHLCQKFPQYPDVSTSHHHLQNSLKIQPQLKHQPLFCLNCS